MFVLIVSDNEDLSSMITKKEKDGPPSASLKIIPRIFREILRVESTIFYKSSINRF